MLLLVIVLVLVLVLFVVFLLVNMLVIMLVLVIVLMLLPCSPARQTVSRRRRPRTAASRAQVPAAAAGWHG